MVEFLAILVPRLAAGVCVKGATLGLLCGLLSNGVIVIKSGLQNGWGNAHVSSQICARVVLLHDPTTLVVFAVPVNGVGRLRVQNQSVWGLLSLPHLARNIVTATELVAETTTFIVEQNTALTSQSLCSQKLDLGVSVIGLNETCGVNLDPFQINRPRSNSFTHLDTISSAVFSVRCWEVHQIRSVLGEQ